MAIYLTHLYGQRYYGPEPELPHFDAERFAAYSVDYSTVRLTWEPPVGEFEAFRLIKNRFGLPQSEIDGDILVDTTVPDVGYDDVDIAPAEIQYYAVYLKIGGVWTPAGYASCLHIANLGSINWLWHRLPLHYRMLRGNHLTLEADDNLDLLRYLSVIGWGLDRVRTAMRAAFLGRDIDTTHEALVDLIIAQLGLPTYPGLTGLRRRAIARDGVALAAAKGTYAAMEAIVRTASGWDVEIRPARNMIGSYDRSRAHHPLPPDWDASIHYDAGDRVYFYGVSYECLTPAYSYDQMPDGEGATNTWWKRLMKIEAGTVAHEAGSSSQHGWQGISMTAGQGHDKVETRLALGIPKPGDPVIDTNAITVHNLHNAALDAAARLLPVDLDLPNPDPYTVITNAVPLPVPQEWHLERVYRAGSVVSYRGRIWHARRPSPAAVRPALATGWVPISTDNRVRLNLSAYTHQPHTDNTKNPVAATMYLEFYDDRGNFLGREIGTGTSESRILDTFTTYSGHPLAPLGGRGVEYGVQAWTDQVAGFIRDSYTYGVARPALDATRSISTLDYGSANAVVSATFLTSPAEGQVQALILRYVSTSSYLRATRTALQTVDGPTVTTLVTYATPIADGDRLTVTANGNNLAVQRNGTQVATTTSSFNNSATIFGIAVEDA